MIRRSPCEVYIKFLASHPEHGDTDTVRRVVRAKQLDYPSDDYVDALRRDMRIPDIFRPTDKLHRRSFNLLVRHQILGFYHPDETSLMAQRLLEIPRAKELIETMSLSGAPASLIAHRLRATNVRATPSAVSLYLMYFWDLEHVDQTELRALFDMRISHLAYRDDNRELTTQERLQFEALKRAQYKDRRRVLLEMPATPMAGIMNQMMLGFMPSQMELSKLASAGRSAALLRTMEALMASARGESATMGRDYALIAKTLQEIVNDIGDASSTLQRDLQQLSVQTDTTEVPHINELTQGNHTTEMDPRLDGSIVHGGDDVGSR